VHDRYELSLDWTADRRLSARIRSFMIVLWLGATGGVDIGETELLPKGSYTVKLVDLQTGRAVHQQTVLSAPVLEREVSCLLEHIRHLREEEVDSLYFEGNPATPPRLLSDIDR